MPGELLVKVAELREQGFTPKAIAKTLGMRQSDVSELVRLHAASRSRAVARETAIVGSWMNQGWSGGLSWQDHPDWSDESETNNGAYGLVSVLLAREHRYGNVTVCGYLVDTHCLGVKNAIGPRILDRVDLNLFRQRYFARYGAPPLPVPFDLVQHLVLGAVAFAKGLGFEPAPDFAGCRDHLGEWNGASAIRFGCAGKPRFVNGSDDPVGTILSTLERTVGRGNFDSVILG